MKLDALFDLIEARQQDVLTGIYLTAQNEANILKSLLEEPRLLEEETFLRLLQDKSYIRTFLATIGGVPVFWNATAFNLS